LNKKILAFLISFVIIFSSFAPVSKGQTLSASNKYLEAEKVILEAWNNRKEDVVLFDYKISIDEFNYLKDYVENNNTEYFYADVSTRCTYDENTRYIYRLYLEYHFSEEEVVVMKNEFDAKCERILNSIPNDVSVEEKLLLLHDYIASHTSYDKTVYEGLASSNEKYIYNSYGCIVKEIAVCEGISEAFLYLCKRLNIECHLVTSDSMHHEWNMVKVGNDYYHIDITQDAPVYNLGVHGYHQSPGDVNHRFFLLSDEEIKNEELGHSVHYSWIAPYKATNSTTFKNSFWKGISSVISYVDGNYYYIKDDSLVKYNHKLNHLTTLSKNSDSFWTCSCEKNHLWKGSFSKATKGAFDQIYFIYANSVYAYDLNTQEINLVYNRTGQGFIYCIMYKHDTLYVSVRNDEEHSGEVHYFYYDLQFKNFAFVGDGDNNGIIDISDALKLRKYLIKQDTTINEKADINNDGKVNVIDLALLRKKLAS